MVWTNQDRLNKLAWFRSESERLYTSRLKKQKFLFFYEMFSKVMGEEYDLSYLKAYPNGPVFSEVYGDDTYENSKFNEEVQKCDFSGKINEKIGRAASTLVATFTEKELSDLTHELDLWKSKEERILSGEKQIPIYEDDITENDITRCLDLYEYYTDMSNQNYEIIEMYDKIFMISQQDYAQLTDEHSEVIEQLSTMPELSNPVYLELEDGVLLVD